ncbi:MAG: sulfite exporter TauE/SafE family protein [Patescibacteria group bacterium]
MSKKKYKSPTSECKVYIDGMHCSSCELLIEKKLLKRQNVASVDVSRKDNSAQIIFHEPDRLHLESLNQEFKDLGYSFSNKLIRHQASKLFYRDKEGSLRFNKAVFPKVLKSLALTLVLLVVFFIVERLQLGQFISVDATSSLIAFFLLGLVAGLSSCAALVGGLLLSMIKQWHDVYIDDDTNKKQPHVLFHVGRLTSFFVFGGALGLLGETISLNNTTVYAVLVMIISVLMLLLALQMLDVSWAQKFQIRLPKFITRAAANEKTVKGRYMPFATGVLTFFLPCGFTLIAQGIALTTGSFLQGAIIMLLFALGTLPVLLGISFTGLKFTKKPHLTAKFSQVAGIIIIFFALYNINGQLNVLGYTSLSDVQFSQEQVKYDSENDPIIMFGPNKGKRVSEVSETNTLTEVEGEQTLSFIAQGFEYVPTGPTTLQAGVPTKLVVDDRGILGCGAFIAARGLFNGYVALEPGENVIDLGTPKKGSYKVTCSMGMVPPVTVRFK